MKIPASAKAKIITQNLIKSPLILGKNLGLGVMVAGLMIPKSFLPDDDDTRIIARAYVGLSLIGGAGVGLLIGALTPVGLLAATAGGLALGLPVVGGLMGLRAGVYETKMNIDDALDNWRSKNGIPLPPQNLVEASAVPKKTRLRSLFSAKTSPTEPMAEKPVVKNDSKPSPPSAS